MAEDLSTRQLIGYVLFFNTLDERSVGAGGNCADDPVAVIEDLYVDQEYRRRGIATQLFTKVLGVRFSAMTRVQIFPGRNMISLTCAGDNGRKRWQRSNLQKKRKTQLYIWLSLGNTAGCGLL